MFLMFFYSILKHIRSIKNIFKKNTIRFILKKKKTLVFTNLASNELAIKYFETKVCCFLIKNYKSAKRKF